MWHRASTCEISTLRRGHFHHVRPNVDGGLSCQSCKYLKSVSETKVEIILKFILPWVVASGIPIGTSYFPSTLLPRDRLVALMVLVEKMIPPRLTATLDALVAPVYQRGHTSRHPVRTQSSNGIIIQCSDIHCAGPTPALVCHRQGSNHCPTHQSPYYHTLCLSPSWEYAGHVAGLVE